MRTEITELFSEIKEQNPLVHQISNKVTVNDCANVTLAIGASPVMADFTEEVEEVTANAKALLLNLGTLNDSMFEAMLLAGKRANQCDIPVIFDPVGASVSTYRFEKAVQLLNEVNLAVIKGNHSEVASLVGQQATETNGVDTGVVNEPANKIALAAAHKFDCVVAISGKVDVIATHEKYCFVHNGNESLARITGTGCTSGSLIAAFAAVTKNYYQAAIAGLSTMGICGERANACLTENEGLGMFKVRLMDQISMIDGHRWKKDVKISEFRFNKIS